VQAVQEYFADELHMGFAEDLVVVGINLVDFYSALAPRSPSQQGVIDVEERLLGVLE
jgi:hypothetical protein